jgi:zinc transport system substrate-binding protein
VKRLLLLSLVTLCACKQSSGDKPQPGADKPVVVASIFPLHDLVRRIGGTAIESKLLLEPGKSEHNYVGTARDAKIVARAKVAFLIGLALDEWTEKIVTASGGNAKIVELGEIVGGKLIPLPRFEEEHKEGDNEPEGEGEEHHDHSGTDPHLWLSIPKVKQMTPEIEKALAEAFPESKATFAANRQKLVGRLPPQDPRRRRREEAPRRLHRAAARPEARRGARQGGRPRRPPARPHRRSAGPRLLRAAHALQRRLARRALR